MRKRTIVFLLCLLLVFSGFAGVAFSASADAPGGEAASGNGGTPYEEDYELLWEALRSSYPYLPYLETIGIDTEEICSRYAAKTKTAADDTAFAGILRSMLSELRNFSHLNVVTPELYQSYYYIYILREDVVPREYAEPFRAVLTDPALSERYQPPASAEAFERRNDDARQTDVSVLYYFDCKALYLNIPSFSQELVDRDRNLVRDCLTRYPETEHIIFDISGNSGGSDLYWMENLVAPFGGRYEFSYRNYLKSSPFLAPYFTAEKTGPVSELNDAPDWASELGLDLYTATRAILPDRETDQPALDSGIKRWVLTSGSVYSSSEKFACFCKATGWAVTVGKRTAGDGLGSTPVLLLLPHSGLLIRFSATVGENPDGSINAVRGTSPDILCVKNTLPLNRCLEEIRKESAS